jgi:uncharacterized protein YciI
MPLYAVTYRYTDDAEKRQAVRPTHREFLRGLGEQGLLVVSGPYAEAEQPPGALLILRADSKNEVSAALDKDPFRTEGGIIADVSMVEWQPVSGPLAERF